MSLADELLADLEDASDDLVNNELIAGGFSEVKQVSKDNLMQIDSYGGTKSKSDRKLPSVRELAKLSDSAAFRNLMRQVDTPANGETSERSGQVSMEAPFENEAEYSTIVQANSTAVEIDNEIAVIHKYCRDLYAKRFPELESLVPSALEYIKTVNELRNDVKEKAKERSAVLQAFLTHATIMVLSVTASTTTGVPLTADELEKLEEACSVALELDSAKRRIYEYVATRMQFVAPNLSVIVGAGIAAQLVGIAGGLQRLSRIPACNVLLLGAQRRGTVGLSAVAAQPHTGLLFRSDIVQRAPPDLQRRLARIVAAKCALAARVDAFRENRDGRVGIQLLGEIERKLDKWQEPPPVKQVKALPVPGDPVGKKRGGRRYRKMKERLGLTDLRARRNRMQFGVIEQDAYQDDLGMSMGTLASRSGSGRVRAALVDPKTKARVSKSLAEKLRRQNAAANSTWGGTTSIRRSMAGTASVVFTPVQGLEIVNPRAAEQREKEDGYRTYFAGGATSTFKVPMPAPARGSSGNPGTSGLSK